MKGLDIKGVCMCQAIQDIRKEEHNLGKMEQAQESARNFYAMGLEIEKIAEGLGQTIEMVKQWIGDSVDEQ